MPRFWGAFGRRVQFSADCTSCHNFFLHEGPLGENQLPSGIMRRWNAMVFRPTRALEPPATIWTVLSGPTATWQIFRWSLSGWATTGISPTTNFGSRSLTNRSSKAFSFQFLVQTSHLLICQTARTWRERWGIKAIPGNGFLLVLTASAPFSATAAPSPLFSRSASIHRRLVLVVCYNHVFLF